MGSRNKGLNVSHRDLECQFIGMRAASLEFPSLVPRSSGAFHRQPRIERLWSVTAEQRTAAAIVELLGGK